jgi:hypothetical protein
MYSYKDRIRAVRLYIKLGKRIAATIRRLGYPTKNSLKAWHREFDGARQLGSPLVLPHEGMLPDALLSSHFILLPSRGLPGVKRPAPSSNRLFSGSRLSVGAIA